MKLSNAQIVTEMVGAYQRGDEGGLASFIDPAIEVFGEEGGINSGSYSGLEGFRQWSEAWEEAWDDTRYEVVRVSDVGPEFVVAAVRVTGVGRASRVPSKNVYGWLWQIRNGRVTRFHAYLTLKTAVRRAGELSEAPAR